MTLPYKILACILLVTLCVLAGYYEGKGDVKIVEKQVTVTKQGETQIVYKDRIVTVTRIQKPDGTVTEVTKTEDKDKQTDKKTEEHVVQKDTSTTPALSRFSLGLFGYSKLTSLQEIQPQLGVSAGVRALGDIWIKAGFIPSDRSVTLGVEIQL